MRKILSVALLVMAVVLTGCSQEKTQVETYLNAVEASKAVMLSKGKEMQTYMDGMQQEMMKGGTFDAQKVKDHLAEFIKELKAEQAKVEALSVPDKCKTLHEAVVKQYKGTIGIVEKTPAMVDIAKKASEIGAKIKADPKKQKEAMLEMRGVQEEMFKFQQEVMPMAKENQEQDKIIEAEQKKLRAEFKLPPLATPTPAAGAPGQPGAAPGQPAGAPGQPAGAPGQPAGAPGQPAATGAAPVAAPPTPAKP